MATKAERRQATQNRVKAMGHPLRAEAFRVIRDMGPICPSMVADMLEVDVRNLTYHVKKLEDWNCVEEVFQRPVRGAVAHFYRATEQHLVDLEEWQELVERDPAQAGLVCDSFVQLIADDYTESRLADIVSQDELFHITRTPLILDPEGLQEGLESAEAHRNRMLQIASRSAERRMKGKTQQIPVSSSILLFKTAPADKPQGDD